MKIEKKQELQYVMDFYDIPFVPIKDGRKNMGKVTREMKYVPGTWKYKDCSLAFEKAFEQVQDVIYLKKHINECLCVVAVHHCEEYTWEYPDVEGGVPCHHVYPRTVVKETETELSGTMDEVFVKLYKMNNRLRYCNGEYYKFKDEDMQEMYHLWNVMMPEWRSFHLFYGNGIVD